MRKLAVTAACCIGLTPMVPAISAHAQMPAHSAMSASQPHAMPGMPASATAAAAQGAHSPSSAAFMASDKAMMEKMSVPYSGDTDKDFVAHMMPHHEGAVEMARIELQYGKDPALKRMARDIIKSQTRETVFMKQWQARHGVK